MKVNNSIYYIGLIFIGIVGLLIYDHIIYDDKKIQVLEKVVEPDHNTSSMRCKELAYIEYTNLKKCFEDIEDQNLSGVEVGNKIESCYNYREEIDYSQNNPCYDAIKNNDVLYGVCNEYVDKNKNIADLSDYNNLLKFRIEMSECMSNLIYRSGSFAELSKYLGYGSSFVPCNTSTECISQEYCSVNISGRCQLFQNHIYTLEELDIIIRDNEFAEMGCAHSGLCSIKDLFGNLYYYKQNVPIRSLLQKYNKVVPQERTE